MPERIGCDLVQISRMEKHLEQLQKRILSESDYARAKTMSLKRQLEFTAGRFALKEALVKAFGGMRCADSFQIETGESLEPVVVNESVRISCSVSHDGGFAFAVVIAEDA